MLATPTAQRRKPRPAVWAVRCGRTGPSHRNETLRDKDQVEAVPFDAICSGTAKLAAVQKAVATDWSTALAVLHLPRSQQ